MKIHPFNSLSLQGKNFHVLAVPEPAYNAFGYSTSQLSVVEVDVSELERFLGNDFDPNTPQEDSQEKAIGAAHTYTMPFSDCKIGSVKIEWLGNSHSLRALRGSSIKCETVAFVASPNAIACLQTR